MCACVREGKSGRGREGARVFQYGICTYESAIYIFLLCTLGSSVPKKCGKRQKETTSASSHDLSNEDPLSQAATVTARGKGTSLHVFVF